MRWNIENCLRCELPPNLDWLVKQLIGDLKELRDRARKGEMAAVLHEFFNLYRFDDNQMDNDGFWGPDAQEFSMRTASGEVKVKRELIEPRPPCTSFGADPDLKPGPLTMEDRGWKPEDDER